MPLPVEKLPDVPIVILTYADNTEADDVHRAFAQVAHYLQQDQFLYVVNDLSHLTNVNFGAMVMGAAEVSKAGPGSLADPRTQHILVGEHLLIKMSGEAMKQDQYGKHEVPVFPTVDAALEYVRLKIHSH
jgi:hypothetical protein